MLLGAFAYKYLLESYVLYIREISPWPITGVANIVLQFAVCLSLCFMVLLTRQDLEKIVMQLAVRLSQLIGFVTQESHPYT